MCADNLCVDVCLIGFDGVGGGRVRGSVFVDGEVVVMMNSLFHESIGAWLSRQMV